MDIGIIGSGKVGRTLARIWLDSGHRVMLSYTRQATKLTELVRSLGAGASAGTPIQAARFGEVILLAVPFPPTPEIVDLLSDLEGKIVIDCANPSETTGQPSAAERIADWASKAHVVKAYANVPVEMMVDVTHHAGQMPALFYCGNDPLAKRVVARLIQDSGFEPVDAGPLASARYIELLAPLWYAVRDAGLSSRFAYSLLRMPVQANPSSQ